MSLDKKVQLVSESLARAVDRRKFLKGAGTTVFGTLAALATGQVALARSVASGSVVGDSGPGASIPPWPPTCAPPGPYCNNQPNNGLDNRLSGCRGSYWSKALGHWIGGGACSQHMSGGQVYQCRVYYIYQAGCWTTPVAGGYWTCCDCECPLPGGGRATCGCAQFRGPNDPPPPTPDGPTEM